MPKALKDHRPEPGIQFARMARWLAAGLTMGACASSSACRLNGGKDPDDAPERGLNPIESREAEAPVFNQLEPLEPQFDRRCSARLEEQTIEDNSPSFFEVRLEGTLADTPDVTLTIRDPNRLDYSRTWLQILDQGVYTVQIVTPAGEGCWAGAEINREDADYTLIISAPTPSEGIN